MKSFWKMSPFWFFMTTSTLLAPPKSCWYLRKVAMYGWLSGIILVKPAWTLSWLASAPSAIVIRMNRISSQRRWWKIQ